MFHFNGNCVSASRCRSVNNILFDLREYLEKSAVQSPHVNDVVHLLRDVPELELRAGDIGVVVSIWHGPACRFEVEIRKPGEECPTRVVLVGSEIEAEEGLLSNACQI